MSKFDRAALEDFYGRVSAAEGMAIPQVEAELKELFGRSRSPDDLDDFRMSRGKWKKLNDEICPVMRFLSANGHVDGRVKFPLDNHPPDCWFWLPNERKPVGIEVTIAQARERLHLMQELVENGVGRGFIGLPDNAAQAEYDRAIARPRTMYSSDQAINATKAGVLSCLQKKNKPKYEGMVLLVQAPLGSISEERWFPMIEELKEVAAQLPFAEVHLVGGRDMGPQSMRLK